MTVTGYDLAAAALKRQGVEDFFYLMGGPMQHLLLSLMKKQGVRGIDVRHEQAAAMMAHAYSRLTNKHGLCCACSGPGSINLSTGLANALVDCAPVVALGGSSPVSTTTKGVFQEFDQVAVMKPVTKWAERIVDPHRIPHFIDLAFRTAISGKPGPVYLDLPSDVLYAEVDEAKVEKPYHERPQERSRPQGDPAQIEKTLALLEKAERPLVISGSGVLWSGAADTLRKFVETTGLPIYTTPQGRGVLPEDHPHAFLNARSTALRETDFILVVGTRLNYVFAHGMPPRISGTAKMVRIDIDPAEIGNNQRVDIGIVGDAKAVLEQLSAASRIRTDKFAAWRKYLGDIEAKKQPAQEKLMSNDQTPIHPLRLCKEIRDFMDRDAILAVDGQEILNFGRQSIPTFVAGHRMNSGVFGIMGVGMPFGVGAKVAKPDKQVIVLHGDGSFGMNCMELDTAARHNIPVIVVISLNGGWTGDPEHEKPGRDLGYTRFDQMAKAFGCHGEYVEKPGDIRPALERAKQAIKNGKPALVNVVTDSNARATTVRFSKTMT